MSKAYFRSWYGLAGAMTEDVLRMAPELKTSQGFGGEEQARPKGTKVVLSNRQESGGNTELEAIETDSLVPDEGASVLPEDCVVDGWLSQIQIGPARQPL